MNCDPDHERSADPDWRGCDPGRRTLRAASRENLAS